MRVAILNFFMLALNMMGRKRANPEACPTNGMKLPACDECTDDPVCEDSIPLGTDAEAVIKTIEFDGETHEVNLAVGSPYLDAKLNEIAATKEIDTSVNIKKVDGVYKVYHIGACVMTNAVVGETTNAGVRCCEYATITTFKTFASDTIPNLSVADEDGNITSEAFANNPYGYTGDPAIDAATAEQLAIDTAAALDALGYDYTDATAAVTADDEGFFICIETTNQNAPMLGTVPFSDCGNKAGFVCPAEEAGETEEAPKDAEAPKE